MGILRWEAPRHWGWSILRTVYARRLVDRPSLFVGPTVRRISPQPLDLLPPHLYHYLYVLTRNLCSRPYVRVRACVVNTHHHKILQRTALRQTAPRRQHNAANTKTPIRSEPKLLCREPRTPAGTHAFFAHDHPARIYGSVSSSSPHLPLIVIIRMNKDSLSFISGRAIRDTESWPKSLPTGQLLCPQYFLMLPPGIR